MELRSLQYCHTPSLPTMSMGFHRQLKKKKLGLQKWFFFFSRYLLGGVHESHDVKQKTILLGRVHV